MGSPFKFQYVDAPLLGGISLPATLPGIAAMGLLGATGEGIDKLHPLTGEKSDYETLSAKENLKDLYIKSI